MKSGVMSEQHAIAEDIARVARGFIAKLRQVASKVPFAVDAAAMYYAMLDPKTPLRVKATAAAALLYFITPLDAIVDFLPFVGYSDDAAVLYAVLRTIQAHVTDEHIAAAKRLLNLDTETSA
jgi:uncharacterized membrane protein YkvA (DUF1232 family)